MWRPSGRRVTSEEIEALNQTVAARGPDAEGVWLHPKQNLGLGHRRLAIVDLSPAGRQPMISASGRLAITFNGEIYNFVELRERLGAQGWSFGTASDTEVLLAAIEAWGLETALAEADGMFAFGLWDEAAQALTLARDRFGEKPLYYLLDQAGLVFGSSLAVLQGARGGALGLDPHAARALLTSGFVGGGRSMLSGVAKLDPGHWARFRQERAGLAEAKGSFWSARRQAATSPSPPASLEDAADQLEERLQAAVARACRADAPYGAFLSGGLDSACVVALMTRAVGAPPRTFTVGFEDPLYDESADARTTATALETRHSEIRLSNAEIASTADQMLLLADEPSGDVSLLPTFALARAARSEVKVVLSGDGGDELFGGYSRYTAYARLAQAQARGGAPALALIRAGAALGSSPAGEWAIRRAAGLLGRSAHGLSDKLRKLAAVGAADPEAYYAAVVSPPPPTGLIGPALADLPLADRLEVPPAGSDLLRLRLADIEGFLPGAVLHKLDRATMAVGLEARAPFLAAPVARFGLGLGDQLLTRGGRGKVVVRALAKRLLPPAIVERPKAGFTPPVRRWLSGPLRPAVREVLGPESLRCTGLFDPAGVNRLVKAMDRGDPQAAVTLWRALSLQAWARRHLHNDG